MHCPFFFKKKKEKKEFELDFNLCPSVFVSPVLIMYVSF